MYTDPQQLSRLQQRFAVMLEARQSYEAAWEDLADHFLPTRYRNVGKNPDSWRKMPMLNDKLVDATGILAMRTLAAGLQGGMTSPARPWFQLSLEDSELAAHAPMRTWLMDVSKRMAKIFSGSNFYSAVHTLYGELGTFGTAFMLELADFEHGFRFLPFCAGEYCLDVNARQKVDVVFRRFRMSARQLKMHFGAQRLPDYILKESSHGRENSYTVVHAIFPRKEGGAQRSRVDYDLGQHLGDYSDKYPKNHEGKQDRLSLKGKSGRGVLPKHMPFASVYWLEGHRGPHSILSESGFEEFPGFGVRWDVAGNDVYGRSPAMDVLPDCRMLQQMGITMLKAIHKAVDPPTAVSASLKSVGLDLTPGGINYVEVAPGQSPQAATPILDVRPEIQGTRLAIQDVQKQIQQGLYNDLFRLLLDNSKRQHVTAKEVAVREEEKLILLGPALERLHFELFTPLIERTFQLMLRHNMAPPMPKEFQGQKVKVEFVSLLAQAQKMVSTSAVDRLVAFVKNLSASKPEVADMLNADKAVEEYAEYLGVAPALLHSVEERQKLRETRQEQQEILTQQNLQQEVQKQSLETLETVSKVASNLGSVSLEEETLASKALELLL